VTPSAGWYPDPGGSGKLRYWNGQAWTGHVSPPDPAPEPEPQPVAPVPAPEVPEVLSGAGAVLAGPPTLAVPPVWQQPSPSTVSQPLGPDGSALAGWGRRAAGYTVDVVVVAIIAVIGVVVFRAVTGGMGDLIDADQWNELLAKAEANPGYQPTQAEAERLIGPDLLPTLGQFAVLFLTLSAINGVVLVAAGGRTLGDRLVGISKVGTDGRKPGVAVALLRWLFQALLFVGGFFTCFVTWIPLILDYLWPLWDQRRQALHDKVARTYVERSALTGPVNR